MPLKKQSGEPRRKTPDIDLRLSHTCTHMCTCIYANKCAHMHTPHTNTDCAVIAPNAWSTSPPPARYLSEGVISCKTKLPDQQKKIHEEKSTYDHEKLGFCIEHHICSVQIWKRRTKPDFPPSHSGSTGSFQPPLPSEPLGFLVSS